MQTKSLITPKAPTPTAPPSQPATASHKWVRHRCVGYMRGRGLTFGVGSSEPFPRTAQDLGKYSINVDLRRHSSVAVCDSTLDVIAVDSLDWVFVGQGLERHEHPHDWLRSAVKRLRTGGHMMVCLPTNNPAEDIITRFDVDGVVRGLSELGRWRLKARYERDGWFLVVLKRVRGKSGCSVDPLPTKPRACIIRYGAIGDMIMLSPLIRRLAEDGYEVTMNVTPYGLDVLRNNPYVSNFIIQERDAVPNKDLGEYWAEWERDYDKYINLSESIEGRMLKVEGRREFFTHQAWRSEYCSKNYYDFTMELGGYAAEQGRRGELYFTKEELLWAQALRKKHAGKFLVLWAVRGSSHHKVYPLMAHTLSTWLDEHSNAVAVLVGDARSQEFAFEHPQVVSALGSWSVREMLVAASVADCVVGPETALLNAAGCFETPKIALLSHSSPSNLTKYWANCYALEPTPEAAPCYPCHQLHYTRDSCPLAQLVDPDSGEELAVGPACAMGAIEPQRIMDALDLVYSQRST